MIRRRRNNGRRTGSALVLAVALLVMLAVLGASFLATAQSNRTATAQFAGHTQDDLLVEALADAAKRPIVDSAPGSGGFAAPSAEYHHWTSLTDDRWLADRVPRRMKDDSPAGAGNPVYWRFVSAPPFPGAVFESPFGSLPATSPVAARERLVPTKIDVSGQAFPALRPIVDHGAAAGLAFVAADADGDGIADAALFRLPVPPINGVTYYGAVRVVDNAAAVNASVAWEPNPVDDIKAGLPGDFFPTNVDLAGLLPKGAQLDALNAFRFVEMSPSLTPIDEIGRQIDHLRFASAYEAVWMQLGRRLANPGFMASARYRSLSLADSLATARRFCVGLPGGGASVLDRILSASPAPVAPYAPGSVNEWFNENFAYARDGSANMPARALLVARNAVSNRCPSRFNPRGTWQSGSSYRFGDLVTHEGKIYVYVGPGEAGANSEQPSERSPNWVFKPWTTGTAKTPVNTADFGQLWLAYWSVMTEESAGPNTPIGGVAPGGLNPDGTGTRMFRNSLRSNAKLSAQQEMVLRAGLAALNTISLRQTRIDPGTGLDDVPSRLIQLPAGNGYPPVNAMLYGIARQPFITEVYAQNDQSPQNDYVAVELFNPYPQPLTLRGWALALLTRPNLSDPNPPEMQPEPIESTVTGATNWNANPPVVPPGGYLVLASSGEPPTGVEVAPSPAAPMVVIPELVKATRHELVLLRPRCGDGTLGISDDERNPYDEGTPDDPNLSDFIPVDSYDFTNLSASGIAAATQWHYIRPNDSAPLSSNGGGKAWHYVYPGRYVLIDDTVFPSPNLIDGTLVAPVSDLSTLGRSDKTPRNPQYHDTPVQLKNADAPGPFPWRPGQTNQFPFGGFARNGDILQVPFIGAYRITPTKPVAGTFLELNSVTMDAAYADDDDSADDFDASGHAVENIGHFCPIDGDDLQDVDASRRVDDFGPDPAHWRYHWATRLLDYLTVLSPQPPLLPEIDPAVQGSASADLQRPGEPPAVEGLININTAPWRVLAAVPWLPPRPDQSEPQRRQLNALIAQSIVDYRDGTTTQPAHGAFHSLFELNRVPVGDGGLTLREMLGPTDRSAFGPSDGNLSPYQEPPGDRPVYSDFSSRFLVINRTSNLLNTRSDSFTVYVAVQGWRNAGTPAARMVSQRRAAFVIDRTNVTPTDRSAHTALVPAE